MSPAPDSEACVADVVKMWVLPHGDEELLSSCLTECEVPCKSLSLCTLCVWGCECAHTCVCQCMF